MRTDATNRSQPGQPPDRPANVRRRINRVGLLLLATVTFALLMTLAIAALTDKAALAGRASECPAGLPSRSPTQLQMALSALAIWSDFRPTGWVSTAAPTCSITVTDSVGLQEDTARYRYSTDGGMTWSNWSADSLEVSGILSVVKHITVTGVSFPESAHSNQIEFRIQDILSDTNQSPTYTVAVDYTPPAAPGSLAALPEDWTNTNGFDLAWVNPADTSGIVGAHYTLDTAPTAPTDGTYVAGEAIETIAGLTVSTEGEHPVYVWLQDAAGNVDHVNRTQVSFRYDASPPVTTLSAGRAPGATGWYTDPVDVTLAAEDALSGPAQTFYQINGSDLVAASAFTLDADGVFEIDYYSVDNAGNAEAPQDAIIQLDLTPPGAPIGLQTQPRDWTSTNSFSATWTDPPDDSGVVAAYFKVGAPPVSATDGTLVTHPAGRIDGIQVPHDGTHDLHIWLVDDAGNLDHTHLASATSALQYDSQPPITTAAVQGQVGLDGWYRSPVTVTLTAQDGASGVASTRYRVGGGDWSSGSGLFLDADGLHEVEYYSIDVAANQESIHSEMVKIDTIPPESHITSLSAGEGSTLIDVEWLGSDEGSGILSFDVESKDGAAGTWVPWLQDTPDTAGQFSGQRGHTYYFRSRAHDRAGNMGSFPADAGARHIYLDSVANGGFETGDFSNWSTGGALNRAVVPVSGHDGQQTSAALLGNPELGPCYNTQPEVLPIGDATIWQTAYIPQVADVANPALHFWYHMITYDVVWSTYFQTYADSFDVELSVAGSAERDLLLRDGNYDVSRVGPDKPPTDLGWREAMLDLSAYAGQTITLYFRINNRFDHYFNTWVYVDNVSIVSKALEYPARLPLLLRGFSGGYMAQQVPDTSVAPPPR